MTSHATCTSELSLKKSEADEIAAFLDLLKTTSFSVVEGKLISSSNEHVSDILKVIKNGFKTWVKAGKTFSPSVQNIEDTVAHSSQGRGILYYVNEVPIATYSFEPVTAIPTDDGLLSIESLAWQTTYKPTDLWEAPYFTNRTILFRKFSVKQSMQNQGLGRLLMDDFTDRCQKLGYDSILVESSPQAPWLFQWYKNMDFIVVGTNQASSRGTLTFLMRKSIIAEKPL